jgi:hypothetical protein
MINNSYANIISFITPALYVPFLPISSSEVPFPPTTSIVEQSIVHHKEAYDKTFELDVVGNSKLESEDPLHRYYSVFRGAYKIWNEDQNAQDKYADFWSFLEGEKEELLDLFPAIFDPEYCMVWLDSKELREPYKVTFMHDKDFHVSIHTSQDGILEEGSWMFVTMDDEFYVAKEQKYKLHHVSLSGGEKVHSAGMFDVVGGKITNISFSSGHYKPSIENGKNCLRMLLNKSINISEWTVQYHVTNSQGLSRDPEDKIPVDVFLNLDPLSVVSNSEQPIQPLPFLIPFEEFKMDYTKRAEMFLTSDNRLYVGNKKLKIESDLCKAIPNLIHKASINLKENKIAKVMFKTPIQSIEDEKIVKFFVECMRRENLDVDQILFRFIRNKLTTEMIGTNWVIDATGER